VVKEEIVGSRLISGIIGAVLAVGLTAVSVTPAAAQTVQESRFKGQTVVTVDGSAVVALDFFNIRVKALPLATGSTPAYTFPVYRTPADGSTELAGGLQFTANARCFPVIAPVIDTTAGVMKVWLSDGQRIDLFSLNGSKLVLTAPGAEALNSGLGFNGLFSAGFLFGEFQTTLTA
jgi:hypothetical protein